MPQAQTMQMPKRFPLVAAPDNRDSSTAKDAKLVNGYVEKDPLTGDWQLFKRPGTLLQSQPSGGAATGRGIYNWFGAIYSVFGTTMYKNLVSKGTVDGTNGSYKFSQSSGATPRLVLGNGVKGYTYEDGGGLVQITDGDFPSAFYKGWAYLDKTTYIMKSPNVILGSDLDLPTSWDPLNSINAQIRPDTGVGLGQQLVYVIAFKQFSTEIFYDAANATGSPLGTVQGAKVNWGCASIDSVQDIDGMLFWVATNEEAAPQIIMMKELRPEIISTPAVERLIGNADFSQVYSWAFKESGHYFYGLTLVPENLTLVYDAREKQWAQWTDMSGNYFPMCSATKGTTNNSLFQHATNGKIYTIDSSYVNDDGDLIQVDLVSPNTDLGTKRRKLMNVLEFVGDQVAGSVMQVRFNDNDYDPAKWSNFRNVDLSKKRPILTQCGTFSRRATHLRHRCNTAFRISAAEMQIDLGSL